MKSIDLGEYGIQIVCAQIGSIKDISASTPYIFYTKPDGSKGYWDAHKSATSFYYELEEFDIDQAGVWALWALVVWDDTKVTWARMGSLRVRNIPHTEP
jgi:hypothetical protein